MERSPVPTNAALQTLFGSLANAPELPEETNNINIPSYSEQRKLEIAHSYADTLDGIGVIDVETPEMTPVFLGLRKVIMDKRLSRMERKLATLEEKKMVAKHVGEKILDGATLRFKKIEIDNIGMRGGYSLPDAGGYLESVDPKRPISFTDRFRAGRLERIVQKRRVAAARLYHLQSSYGQDLGTPNSPNRIRQEVLNGDELATQSKSDRAASRVGRKIDRLGRRHELIVNAPEKRQEKLLKRRQKLLAKREGIRVMQEQWRINQETQPRAVSEMESQELDPEVRVFFDRLRALEEKEQSDNR
jgi:hypothetical protein